MSTQASTADIRNYLEWARQGSSTLLRYVAAYVVVVMVWRLCATYGDAWLDDHPGASPLARLVVLTVPFMLGLAALPFATSKILRRPAWSFALPRARARWGDLALGFGIGLVAVGVMTLVSLPLTKITSVGWDQWSDRGVVVPFLLLAIFGFLAQCSFEEGLYRGYSEQLVARYTSVIWLVLAVPAFFFASGHLGNLSSATDAPKLVRLLPYLLFALTMAWVAYRTGSLLMAIGLHFANNLLLALVVSTAGDVVPTIAPYQRVAPSLTALVVFAIGQAAISIILVELLVRRRVRSSPSNAATPLRLKASAKTPDTTA